jgi:anti-sigma regulatory factor (Ser/Thr protein kinase)
MEHRLHVPGQFDRLEQISKFVEQSGLEAGLDETAVCRCQLAVDEACTNIIEHAYEGEGHGSIDICCEPEPEVGELTITIEDHGKPFDPNSVPEPQLNTNLEDMQVGGLGLYFMRQVMDAVEFSYANGSNKLVLVKRRQPQAQ